MSFAAIALVDAYWEGLRAGRLMPARAEIDPRGLEGALEYAFILEYIGRGVGRMRIAGSHLNDLLGMEVRGMPLSALIAPEARDRMALTLENVVRRPQVADLTLSSARGIGRPGLKARMYLAPLGDPSSGAPRILGCLQSHGGIGRTPRRFDIDQVHSRRIVATVDDLPQASPAAPAPAAPARAGFAENVAMFGHANTPSPGTPQPARPGLRLVRNSD